MPSEPDEAKWHEGRRMRSTLIGCVTALALLHVPVGAQDPQTEDVSSIDVSRPTTRSSPGQPAEL